MDKLKGAITVELFTDEVEAINKLIEKDEARPIVSDGYDIFDETEKKYACPRCGNRVYTDHLFCQYCGQRLDTKNIEL